MRSLIHSVYIILLAIAATPVLAANFTDPPPDITAARHLRAGKVIERSDLNLENDSAETQTQLNQLVGRESKHAIYAGRPVTKNDVRAKTLVVRNAIVAFEFEKGPLYITANARALDSGSIGDVIRVMNIDSKSVISAVIIGANQVAVR